MKTQQKHTANTTAATRSYHDFNTEARNESQ